MSLTHILNFIRCVHVIEYNQCNKNINPLSTTGLLTPFPIGLYHEMFTCLANYDKALKDVHHKLTHETIVPYTLCKLAQ